MAARSAMGFAAGALRQTVARQTAPQFAPRPLAQQTRAMGASLPPSPHSPFESDHGNPKSRETHRRAGVLRPVHSHRAPRGSSSISAPRLTDPSRDPPPNPQAAAATASRTRASPSTSRARFTSFGRTASAASPGSGSFTGSTRTGTR